MNIATNPLRFDAISVNRSILNALTYLFYTKELQKLHYWNLIPMNGFLKSQYMEFIVESCGLLNLRFPEKKVYASIQTWRIRKAKYRHHVSFSQ